MAYFRSTFLLVASAGIILALQQVFCDNSDALGELGKTTAQLVELRKFKAETHLITTSDGYILNVCRATNPLINDGKGAAPGKLPVLMVHGFTNNGGIWVVNSVDVRPKDWSSLDISSMSDDQLNQMALNETSFKSVALTLLNFGHDVWLLNRRGSYESQGHTSEKRVHSDSFSGQTSATRFGSLAAKFESGYWNFSQDQQAAIDLPQVVDYILETTQKPKLIYIGHSEGGALPLMMLIVKPETAKKIDTALLYAPALYLQNSTEQQSHETSSIAVSISAKYPPNVEVNVQRAMVAAACSTSYLRRTVCTPMMQRAAGPDNGKDVFLPGFVTGTFDTTSTHDAAQLAQTTRKGKTHFFDFMDEQSNRIAYGQPTAPIYDVSQITFNKVKIFYGVSDKIVPAGAVEELISDFRVPVDGHIINGSDWNHFSFFFHKDIPTLLTVPSLRLIQNSAG